MTDLHKPVRRVARQVGPRGFNPDIVITLYPGGVIGLREARRRKEYTLRVAELLILAVKQEIEETRRARKKGRK